MAKKGCSIPILTENVTINFPILREKVTTSLFYPKRLQHPYLTEKVTTSLVYEKGYNIPSLAGYMDMKKHW